MNQERRDSYLNIFADLIRAFLDDQEVIMIQHSHGTSLIDRDIYAKAALENFTNESLLESKHLPLRPNQG